MTRKSVLLCESQPIVGEGVRALLAGSADLEFVGRTDSLTAAYDHLRHHPASVVLVDKSLGMQGILDWLAQVKRLMSTPVEVVVWGASITEPEALRYLQAGARGILRKTSDLTTILNCVRAVAGGHSWMADAVFREHGYGDRPTRGELTSREQQVLELVEQGLKNKEIARELGIRPGTVKIHLKHIFEKTGVRGRYGLALSIIRHKSSSELAPVV